MSRKIKGILFDLGDTLLDFGHLDVTSLFEAGGRATYDYLKGLGKSLPSFAAYHRRQLRAIRWNYFKSKLSGREFNSLDLLGQLAVRMGHQLSRDQMLELAWLWYEPLSRCARMEEGLCDLLKGLAGRGIRLGVVSNTFIPAEVLDRHLGQVGLLELLPVRVYSCQVGYRKPHPGIFVAALKLASLAASEAMFIGDSPKADVFGANRAGMISVLKDPLGRHDGNKVRPCHRIRGLGELPGILAQYDAMNSTEAPS
jgi:putative hydrolase of the HAD superfamily